MRRLKAGNICSNQRALKEGYNEVGGEYVNVWVNSVYL